MRQELNMNAPTRAGIADFHDAGESLLRFIHLKKLVRTRTSTAHDVVERNADQYPYCAQ
jgi:hypothetical protein